VPTAGTPGSNRTIYYDDESHFAQTLAEYRSLVGPTRDSHSVTGDVSFLSTTGTQAGFLHLGTGISPATNAGTPIDTVTADFDGELRSTSTPDIGADEVAAAAACPTIVFQPQSHNVCLGNGISLSVMASSTPAGTTYQWYKGSVAIPGATAAVYQTAGSSTTDAGSYTVLISSQGCSVTSAPAVITISPKPVASFIYTEPGCAPTQVNFTNTSTGTAGLLTYTWIFGNGTSTAANPSQVFDNPGVYQVALVASANGCADTASSSLVVGQRPAPAFTNTAPGCAPASVVFTNSSTGAGTLSYNWKFDDGNTSTDPNPTHVFTTQGVYQVKLFAFSTAGCYDSVIHNITVGCSTGVSNLEAGISDISLLPNAVQRNAVLQVKTVRNVILNWTLADAQGRVLRRFTQRAQVGIARLDLDLTGIVPGTYQLLGQTDKGKVSVLRFVRL
ncbi:MAG: PKD domain-containing protein, partial [Sphingobacteriales bacterium]